MMGDLRLALHAVGHHLGMISKTRRQASRMGGVIRLDVDVLALERATNALHHVIYTSRERGAGFSDVCLLVNWSRATS